ncbi:MAG: GatB/YqeY domain-containing protein [Patescibacteria group bacterium]|nr:GatB/YqeY domain-containing protein [Patescibacteria group bacterium]MDD5164418.1 GatB/YqeY domain-containing protein [Patescibacteria group bacterium]MDD5534605.1 GatB/YqeY domain-containing protein [Patescibacteria group bacterium]
MLLERIEKDFKQALREGEGDTKAVLRMLKSALAYKAIELRPKKQELTDEVAVDIVGGEIKKRREAIELYEKGNRPELAAKEKKELEILFKYMPEQLSGDQVKEMVLNVIKEINAAGPSDFGKVMGSVSKQTKGKADGNQVSQIVKEQLNNI